MQELFAFSKEGGNGEDVRAQTMLCFTGAYYQERLFYSVTKIVHFTEMKLTMRKSIV